MAAMRGTEAISVTSTRDNFKARSMHVIAGPCKCGKHGEIGRIIAKAAGHCLGKCSHWRFAADRPVEGMPRPRKPASPFRNFNSSPEVIRLVEQVPSHVRRRHPQALLGNGIGGSAGLECLAQFDLDNPSDRVSICLLVGERGHPVVVRNDLAVIGDVDDRQ